MKIKFYSFTLLFFCFVSQQSFSQINVKDSSVAVPILMASYAYQFPGGDLVKRFGNNSNIGGNFLYKTKSNWLFGVGGYFLFGDSIKESIFDSISSENGTIIDHNGEYADIRLYERGYSLFANFGKIITFKKPNPNSGLFLLGSMGFLQHKIRIEDNANNTPQVNGTYKQGYDRLTNGFALTEFIGYIYFGNKRLINFYGGIEFTQAWTQGRRFNFDSKQLDNAKRNDYLFGARIGWMLPFYKKVPNEFYYY